MQINEDNFISKLKDKDPKALEYAFDSSIFSIWFQAVFYLYR